MGLVYLQPSIECCHAAQEAATNYLLLQSAQPQKSPTSSKPSSPTARCDNSRAGKLVPAFTLLLEGEYVVQADHAQKIAADGAQANAHGNGTLFVTNYRILWEPMQGAPLHEVVLLCSREPDILLDFDLDFEH